MTSDFVDFRRNDGYGLMECHLSTFEDLRVGRWFEVLLADHGLGADGIARH
jgi:hypothetical protein